MTTRHSWADPERFEHRTERLCWRCDLMKVTRHEQTCWTEWWRDGNQIVSERTPPCDGRLMGTVADDDWQTGEFA
jgi:hypothetical protein